MIIFCDGTDYSYISKRILSRMLRRFFAGEISIYSLIGHLKLDRLYLFVHENERYLFPDWNTHPEITIQLDERVRTVVINILRQSLKTGNLTL